MMYLSRLQLNARSRQAQAEFRNPYEMHRTLSKAFGEGEAMWKQARCLFRAEEEGQNDSMQVLVQSLLPPRWEDLTAGRDYLRRAPEMKSFAPCLAPNQALTFRLRANPTVCQGGKRRGITEEEQQTQWLARKGAAGGFALSSVRVRGDDVIRFVTATRESPVLCAVTFEGVLRVTEPTRFVETLASGLGRAKAFGFGLLSVARA